MFSSGNAFVIYGWKEEERGVVIDAEWLRANGIELFASDMVRNTAGNAIYGVRYDLAGDGVAQVSNELKDKVKAVRDKVVAQAIGKAVAELRFQLALQGDFDWNFHGKYTPGEALVMPDYEAVRRGRDEEMFAFALLLESQRMMQRFGGGRM